jgi:hypothetical protein
MPIETLKGLPSGAKNIFESTMSSLKGKGYTDSQRARMAWTAVKKKYKKVDGKWIPKSEIKEKSYRPEQIQKAKSIDGDIVLEGYVFKFTPDSDGDVLTREFAESTFNDWKLGEYYHFPDSKGLLEIEDKEIKDDGLWARIKLNKENKYYDEAKKLINEKAEKIAISPLFGFNPLDDTVLRKDSGSWHRHILSGEGLGFGLTDVPANQDNVVKAKHL